MNFVIAVKKKSSFENELAIAKQQMFVHDYTNINGVLAIFAAFKTALSGKLHLYEANKETVKGKNIAADLTPDKSLALRFDGVVGVLQALRVGHELRKGGHKAKLLLG